MFARPSPTMATPAYRPTTSLDTAGSGSLGSRRRAGSDWTRGGTAVSSERLPRVMVYGWRSATTALPALATIPSFCCTVFA